MFELRFIFILKFLGLCGYSGIPVTVSDVIGDVIE